MRHSTTEHLRALRPGTAARVAEVFPFERRRTLLEAIFDSGHPEPVSHVHTRSVRRWRPAVASAVALGTAAAVVAAALSGNSTLGPASADAVSFRTAASGSIVATVTHPFAAQSQLDAAFAAQDLRITVNLIPVSPSIVGTVLYVGESNPGATQIKALQGGHCLTGGGGCPIGVEIPRDFHGTGSITLGRPAKPGERYESAASIFAPGEPLHCSGLLGARVSTAVSVLQKDGLTVMGWREDSESEPGVSRSVTLSHPPTHNYVWGAELVESGRVLVTTESTPWPDTPGAGSQYNRGC
ncbi:MAG: hypothetical protein ACTHM1_04150 [Solirubrobacteraceae bacterium]